MGQPARVRQLKEIIAEHRFDIVGVQETIKQDFRVQELTSITAGQQFVWEWIPAHGHSGGILIGVKDDILQVEEWHKHTYSVGVTMRNRRTNLRWRMVVVYGPADHDFSRDFLQEFRDVSIHDTLPLVIGGDFNLVRNIEDKSTQNVNMGLMEEFNKCIEDLALMEIKKARVRYTWTNKQANPIFSNIDRIFVNTEWENKFPLCFAYGLIIIGSNHNPIVLDNGEQYTQRVRQFFFEKQWLNQEGFKEGVKRRWELISGRAPAQAYSMEIWHSCVKGVKQFMKGWGK